MKRLTKKDFNICNVCDRGPLGTNWSCDGFPACGEKAAYDRLAAIEDILGDEYELDDLKTAMCCKETVGMAFSEDTAPVERLRELWFADKDGRCVVLPCKRDDVLWTFHTYPSKRVYSFHVTDLSTLNGRTMLNTDIMGVVDARDVGVTVFLTRAEADAALKAREQDD